VFNKPKKKTGISISLPDVIESDCSEPSPKIIARTEVILALIQTQVCSKPFIEDSSSASLHPNQATVSKASEGETLSQKLRSRLEIPINIQHFFVD
jgi:hypothetical protein